MSVSVILACGGSSSRMGVNKLMIDLCGKSCIRRSAEAFLNIPEIAEIIVVAPKALIPDYEKELDGIGAKFVSGGDSRTKSVANGVNVAKGEYVLIHDGARPLISKEDISAAIADAKQFGGAVVCTKSKDTVRIEGDEGYTPNRDEVYTVRTPQIFKRADYLRAIEKGGDYTDDWQLLESVGVKPHITLGSYDNIKLTTAEDISVAKALIGERKMRIGHGYDVHRLVEGRKLILGGVEIPYEKGLLGHSDADVLAHAISDSLLGAVALGDIGKHFPDSDLKYKGADSLKLLAEVAVLVKNEGYAIVNVDATVLCQAPKLAPHILKMREKLAVAMSVELSQVSVKATTEEGLGFTGSGEGIAVHAVCVVSNE